MFYRFRVEGLVILELQGFRVWDCFRACGFWGFRVHSFLPFVAAPCAARREATNAKPKALKPYSLNSKPYSPSPKP